ncbi:berberine bridge enzyme-like 13 [Abeliophyllum distichum]|uniref:Berberine bridge enzyme-like 13 n=1 Tax=Abeliophyllum distichum TaxID=126358 RepID=A0ABD1TYK3_9LAMI
MKIFKEDGQWVAKSKEFDDELGPSTLPFEDGEEIDEDEDDPLPRPRSHRPLSSTSNFTFTEDHYNILNGRINSLTSTVESLHHSIGNLQHSVNGMMSLLQSFHSRLDAMFPPPPTPET